MPTLKSMAFRPHSIQKQQHNDCAKANACHNEKAMLIFYTLIRVSALPCFCMQSSLRFVLKAYAV